VAAVRPVGRRGMLTLGCSCAVCSLQTPPAHALASLSSPTAADTTRNQQVDRAFARSMAAGMGQYEAAVASQKQALFTRLLETLPSTDAVVVELGMGTFPNAPFYVSTRSGMGPQRLDIIGIGVSHSTPHPCPLPPTMPPTFRLARRSR
jgi:hypothetical protein